jgi:hypothetical protein
MKDKGRNVIQITGHTLRTLQQWFPALSKQLPYTGL